MSLLPENLENNAIDSAQENGCFSNNFDDYIIENHNTGKGTFGTVHSALCKTNNKKCAIKVLDIEEDDLIEDNYNKNSETDHISNEAKLMLKLKHENLLGLHTTFVHKKNICLILDLCEYGSLYDIMKVYTPFRYGIKDEKILATILKDILRGLTYIHSNSSIHRDIKSANILLKSSGMSVIGDFGVSISLINGGLKQKARNVTGTILWMAPEIRSRDSEHNYKCDLWSLGITALELAFGRPPKYSEIIDPNNLITVDKMGQNDFSKQFKEFIKKCLIWDPKKRLDAKSLLKLSFFKKAQDYDYIKRNILNSLDKYKWKKTKIIFENEIKNNKHKNTIKIRTIARSTSDSVENSRSFTFGSTLHNDVSSSFNLGISVSDLRCGIENSLTPLIKAHSPLSPLSPKA